MNKTNEKKSTGTCNTNKPTDCKDKTPKDCNNKK